MLSYDLADLSAGQGAPCHEQLGDGLESRPVLRQHVRGLCLQTLDVAKTSAFDEIQLSYQLGGVLKVAALVPNLGKDMSIEQRTGQRDPGSRGYPCALLWIVGVAGHVPSRRGNGHIEPARRWCGSDLGTLVQGHVLDRDTLEGGDHRMCGLMKCDAAAIGHLAVQAAQRIPDHARHSNGVRER